MAVGSCILGYSNSEVNNFVKKNIDVGNNCTLNSPLEVQLAKKLFHYIQNFKKLNLQKLVEKRLLWLFEYLGLLQILHPLHLVDIMDGMIGT